MKFQLELEPRFTNEGISMKKLYSLLIGATAVVAAGFSASAMAQNVTFHKDIEPILQRSCQNCHREGGVAPMPLVSYEQVAPYAGLIEYIHTDHCIAYLTVNIVNGFCYTFTHVTGLITVTQL